MKASIYLTLVRSFFLIIVCAGSVSVFADSSKVVLRNSSWAIRIDPTSLGVWGIPSGTSGELTLSAPSDQLNEIKSLKVGRDKASWYVPQQDLNISVSLAGAALAFKFTTTKEQALSWPTTGADPRALAAIVPESEGLYIPLQDPLWLEALDGDCREMYGSVLPFWGVQFEGASVAYLLPDELRSQICFRKAAGKLLLTTVHQFSKLDQFPAYEVKLVLTENSPIAPALAYRQLLIENGRFMPFSEKVKLTPEAAKLMGAMHAYLWGDGRTPQAIEQLRRLGIERASLVYDHDPRNDPFVTTETIARAKSFGYLIGPYDNYNGVEDPATANSFTSIFDEEIYRTGGVMTPDGKRRQGFAGYGFELSSEALRRSQKRFIEERINTQLQTGINNYFVDSDATGVDLRDDFDPQHPMNLARDRDNRLLRLSFVSRTKKLVLGSESAAGWSTPVIHFSHGTLTPKIGLWKVLRNRQLVGPYWPAARPAYHFRSVEAPADFATLNFGPQYRLPLFEAVFHDSVVAADFWVVSLMKFRNLVQTRSLLLQLYNVPSLWHLDQQALKEYGSRIKAMNDFFAPLHRQVGTKPLTRFEWLTPDRMVQRVQFADEVTLTANFTDRHFAAVPPRCIEAAWLKNRRKEMFCPEP